MLIYTWQLDGISISMSLSMVSDNLFSFWFAWLLVIDAFPPSFCAYINFKDILGSLFTRFWVKLSRDMDFGTLLDLSAILKTLLILSFSLTTS